jgi:ADP-heptose:LPS heptosyltransferase
VRGLTVAMLAAVLGRCAGVVANDSGVAHLAGLLGLPVLVLFGPTDPVVWTPLGPRVSTLRAPDGQLARLAPDEVWQGIVSLLADVP